MIKKVLAITFLGILLSCGATVAYAKGYSGSRPSYSRSYSRPAPTRNVIVNKTTVVHEHNYNGGGSGNGLLTGMIVGHMLAQPAQQQAPVIIEQAPVQPQLVQEIPQQVAPVAVQQEDSSNTLTWVLFALALFVGVMFVHNANKSKNHG